MRIRLIIFAVVALIGAGCGSGGPGSGSEPLAMVNDEPVSYSEYQRRLGLQSLGFAGVTGLQSAGSDAKIEALGLIIEETLLLQEARRLGIKPVDEEVAAEYDAAVSEYPKGGFEDALKKAGLTPDAYRESLRRKLTIKKLVSECVLDKIEVDDGEAAAYFQRHRDRFIRPESVRARQIVVDARPKADAVLERLKAGEDFAKVAREVSLSPDSASGGDLGYFARGEMPLEFEEVVFSMKPGQMSPVVETPYGFHVFKLEDRRRSVVPKFEEAKEEVVQELKSRRFESAYVGWMAELKEKSKVEVSEDFMDRL